MGKVSVHTAVVPSLQLADSNSSLYTSVSGWTDLTNCISWVQSVFVPFARARHVDNAIPIVLTLDGHDTHEQHELKRVLYEFLDQEDLEIIIFCFPSKTTHKCQPLDVLVFSAVERRWQAACADHATKGIPINRFTVIPTYIQATRSAITPHLIAKAFEKTGLYPVNRSIFTPEDFAPSKASSTIAYVPETFPDAFPSSDAIELSESETIQDSGSQDDSDSTFIIDDEPDDLDNDVDDYNLSGIEDDPTDASPARPASGLMTALRQLEPQVLHRTRSVTSAASAQFQIASLNVTSLEEDRALSHEGLLGELRLVRGQLRVIYQGLGDTVSHLSAANAHCTSIHRELGSIRKQLDSTRKQRERGSKKIKARFVTSRDLRAQFNQDDAERQERVEATAERQRQKEADAAEQDQQVVEDAMNQIFVGQLSSYKKGDLRALAVALALSDKGTNAELISRIKTNLDQHPELQSNQRFSGLFPKQNRLAQDPNALINAPLSPTRNGKYLTRSVQWIFVDYILLFLQVLIFIFQLWVCPRAPIKQKIHSLAKCDSPHVFSSNACIPYTQIP